MFTLARIEGEKLSNYTSNMYFGNALPKNDVDQKPKKCRLHNQTHAPNHQVFPYMDGK